MTAETLVPLAAFVLGALVTQAGNIFRDSKRDERADRQRERERQVATIDELQDALSELVRTTGAIHAENLQTLHAGGSLATTLLPEDKDRAHQAAILHVNRLRVRVADRLMRDDIERFVGLTTSLIMPMQASPEENLQAVEREFDALMPYWENLNGRLGAATRDLGRLIDGGA